MFEQSQSDCKEPKLLSVGLESIVVPVFTKKLPNQNTIHIMLDGYGSGWDCVSGTKLTLCQNFLHKIVIQAHFCVIMGISSLSMFLKLSTLDQYSSEFAYFSP